MGIKISITIIGHNEAYHLKELLPTLMWADEIIYVDCNSQDESIEIATQSGCVVLSRPNDPNLNVNKSFAIEQTKGDWIFYLDPDERISTDLADEIRQVIKEKSEVSAFTLNRKNHYFGKWLRYGSQYPDEQLRLFKKETAHFPKKHVHERLQIKGATGKLTHNLHHYPYLNISQYLHKFDFYTTFEANFLYEQGKKPNLNLAFKYWFSQPIIRFMRRYFFKSGFRDGWVGFFAALFDSLNFIVRYFKLIEITTSMKNKNNNDNS